jgi:hypothetical protein
MREVNGSDDGSVIIGPQILALKTPPTSLPRPLNMPRQAIFLNPVSNLNDTYAISND